MKTERGDGQVHTRSRLRYDRFVQLFSKPFHPGKPTWSMLDADARHLGDQEGEWEILDTRRQNDSFRGNGSNADQ